MPCPRPLSLLLGLAPLLGGGLAWAQLESPAPPAAAPAPPPAAAPVPPPGPAAPASPGAGPAPAPRAAVPLPQGPLVAPPAGPERPPLRPNLDQLGGGPPPRRFDQSLDELVRQGVVTPGERARIRTGSALTPIEALAQQQACRSGALSSQECRSGLAMRWLGRSGGSGRDGEVLPGAAGGRLGADGMPLPPITVPVSALLAGSGGNFSLASVFRVTPRPAPILGNGNRQLLFPVLGSAIPTSSFGWRLHPVLGSWLMHAGQDLAAPEGTPVVAALGGRVVSSGLAGGYGLAIEIEHQHPLRRTLYGHLSELYVQEGARVRQGEVIGRVGSTGLSTGPHLHFELRQPADGGWVAVDPGELDPGKAVAGSDAVALLMGELLQSLERPRPAATAALRPAGPRAPAGRR